MHWADRIRVVLHPTDWDATIVLGPSEGGLGGEDALDGVPASRRNAYPSGAHAFFADATEISALAHKDQSKDGNRRSNQNEAARQILSHYCRQHTL